MEALGIWAFTTSVGVWLKKTILYNAFDNWLICLLTLALSYLVGYWVFKQIKYLINTYGLRLYSVLYGVAFAVLYFVR